MCDDCDEAYSSDTDGGRTKGCGSCRCVCCEPSSERGSTESTCVWLCESVQNAESVGSGRNVSRGKQEVVWCVAVRRGRWKAGGGMRWSTSLMTAAAGESSASRVCAMKGGSAAAEKRVLKDAPSAVSCVSLSMCSCTAHISNPFLSSSQRRASAAEERPHERRRVVCWAWRACSVCHLRSALSSC